MRVVGRLRWLSRGRTAPRVRSALAKKMGPAGLAFTAGTPCTWTASSGSGSAIDWPVVARRAGAAS
eukprot:2038311-Alexandrium_andersonii.AAC.1